MRTISLIIPTLNAETDILHLLSALKNQTRVPDEILVIDSSSDDRTIEIVHEDGIAKTIVIPREEFDHGATRHKALLETSGEYVLFMTQDAIPDSDEFIENLIKPFCDDEVALVSGRQKPKADARRFEQLVREYNYPTVSNVRSSADLAQLGIKTFFASDVCSAYRRSSYEECGGFERTCNTNEDMLMAAAFIYAGWKVAYAADAVVKHSHNLTPKQQYKRNKDVGFFLEKYSKKLDIGSEVREGMQLVKQVTSTLLKEKDIRELGAFSIDCAARLLGNKAGRKAAKNRNIGVA